MISHLITLQECVMLLKNRYREYVAWTLQNYKGHGVLPFPNASWEFNHVPIMEAVIKQIFAQEQNQLHAINYLCPATQELMKLGMERDSAKYVVAELFKNVVDQITAHFPNLNFNSLEEYQYGFCNDYDLMITLTEDCLALA